MSSRCPSMAAIVRYCPLFLARTCPTHARIRMNPSHYGYVPFGRTISVSWQRIDRFAPNDWLLALIVCPQLLVKPTARSSLVFTGSGSNPKVTIGHFSGQRPQSFLVSRQCLLSRRWSSFVVSRREREIAQFFWTSNWVSANVQRA
jgi:hypothetical protein